MALPAIAQAEPILQLYVEGGTYDAASETWIVNSSAGGTATVWVVGNVDGGGGQGTISDVNLAIAYASGTSPTITLTPTTTGDGTFVDTSTPTTPTLTQTVTDGSAPLLADGSTLPSHDIYGAGTDWQEFSLGDFTLTDSPLADFQTAFPTTDGALVAQINAYEITFSGEGTFHIDAYGAIKDGTRTRFAPFSHDAQVVSEVPELSGGATANSAFALLLGCVALITSRRQKA